MKTAALALALVLLFASTIDHARHTEAAQARPAPASGVTLADYQRAAGLRARFAGKALNALDQPAWLPSGKLVYRKTTKGGAAFVLVDPVAGTKTPAFDSTRLATALSAAAKKPYAADNLPITAIESLDNVSLRFVEEGGTVWSCTIGEYVCTAQSGQSGAGGRGRGGRGANAGGGGGGRGAGEGGAAGVTSPDGKMVAYVRDGNIRVRAAGASENDGEVLTRTGTADYPYTTAGISWSPDSTKIATSRIVKRGDRRMVRYVDSSPADQVQPKTFERFYAKPGDELDVQERALIDVAARRERAIASPLFATPYNLTRTEWWKDSRGFTFEYNQRGHQLYRVVEVDAVTAQARTLIDEPTDTFIHYARATGGLSDGGRTYRYDVADGKEIIWMSERDGWAHLYLYDGVTGKVKNQITKGAWMVRGVSSVDEAARTITFMTGGINPKQDPYFVQYYRINFDGTGLTALTDADGYHTATFSTDNRYYVDTWSRVDLAPIAQLRRTSDAGVVMELERGDLAPLTAAGWRAPEAFAAKGRDGKTDIYGVIMRPTNFDPARRYPVLESIYAGPHGSFVPKTFTEYYTMQSVAELGFVVVQIDGMGTANRSKAFHDVAAKNLKDAGFPDRILWHQAVAKKYPWYDITRVGIYGGSAGGQNPLGGMFFHPEFYKAAVAFAGCHDNRMDKIWWNEQWMGYPIGPHYADSSNVTHADKLRGKLLLVVGELDTNVDPSSTMQVVAALIKANKTFDLLVMPGEDHPAGRRGASAPYGDRKLWDFFVANLMGGKPPEWNALDTATAPIPTARVFGDPGSVFGQPWSQVAAGWDVSR
jgi:dipeptidyl aminopeptidase/acylaminoacyl peptidase